MTLARVLLALGVSLGGLGIAQWLSHRHRPITRLDALRGLLAMQETQRVKAKKIYRFDDWAAVHEERKRA